MKITVFGAGSQGDIQPCVALCNALLQAGFSTCLAAPEDFAPFAQKHNVPFYPLRGDVQRIMASDTGRTFMETGGANPLKSIRAMRVMVAPIIRQMTDDAFAACQGADAILCLGVMSAFGQAIAEALHIPIMHLEPTPLLPSRAFAAPSWPVQRNLGGLHNYLSGLVMLLVVWMWYRPFVHDFRKRLGLPASSAARVYRGLRAAPMLSAYSPTIIPPPADWPANIHITGYFFLDAQAGWQPPTGLLRFLEAGDPPVYIGFGSMSGRQPEQLASLVLEALAECGQRGLLLTGWGGLHALKTPEKVFVLDSAPHSWLFPRMAAVVHHGGAGTTAEGLRAGVPTVILPFAFDQSFWGARIKALGLGPAPIPQKKLTADNLARAIQAAVTDTGMQQRARLCGAAIRLENGPANAVRIVQRCFGAPEVASNFR